jgi:hypothetical protein
MAIKHFYINPFSQSWSVVFAAVIAQFTALDLVKSKN